MSSTPASQGKPSAPNTAKLRTSPHPAARDRIDTILEDARSRKVAMGKSSTTESPSASLTPVLLGESSADEETSFVRRGTESSTMDYQSTRVGPQQGARRRSNNGKATLTEAGEVGEGPIIMDEKESWWARMIADYGSIELENKGSVARDHLALERTFLAWLRTSLAFASIGIAVTQLFRLNTSTAAKGSDPYQHLRQMGKPLGATFLGISILMLGVGFHRYFEAQHWIIRGKFPASRGSIALVTAITFALVVASLVVVVVVQPGHFEKR